VTKLRSQPDVDELIGLSIRSRSSSNVERPRSMSQQKQGPIRREADAPKAQHFRRHGIQPLWVIHDRPPTRQTMPQQFQRGVWKPPRK
jgi:hypothetical protein